jgi:hypothetical protein
MRFIFKLTLFAVLALALTACGGGDSGGGAKQCRGAMHYASANNNPL